MDADHLSVKAPSGKKIWHPLLSIRSYKVALNIANIDCETRPSFKQNVQTSSILIRLRRCVHVPRDSFFVIPSPATRFFLFQVRLRFLLTLYCDAELSRPKLFFRVQEPASDKNDTDFEKNESRRIVAKSHWLGTVLGARCVLNPSRPPFGVVPGTCTETPPRDHFWTTF